jgi:hypothetical protein
MRLKSGFALLLLCGFTLPATAQVRGARGTHTRSAVINFRELARQQAQQPERGGARKIQHVPMPTPRFRAPEGVTGTDSLRLSLPAATAPSPLVPSPSPAASFAALGDANTSIPPDTHGAVGPNHLMVVLNTQVVIQNRTGGVVEGPVTLEAFWASVGNPDTFDPKVLYDHLSGRWMFTTMANGESANSAVLIGVSQTNDPSGTWNLFSIDADAAGTNWADYPSMGYNKDWIVVGLNMFAVSNNAFAGTRLYVFKKADLYNNAAPVATHSLLIPAQGSTLVPAITYDGSLATLFLAESGWFNTTTDLLRISTITGAVGSETLNEGVFFCGVPSTRWDSEGSPENFAPQQGTDNKIMNNDDRIQNVVYRSGSLWTAHTIFLPFGGATRSAAQWWQIDSSNGTVQQRGRIDDGTGVLFFAFPTVAVNSSGDALIGFSSFSATQFASASYAFRAAADAAGTTRDVLTFKAGEDTYFKTFGFGRNRWGDYSNTVVDPANDTDFWTIQEYAETDSGSPESFPDRWGTWWAKVVPSGAAATKKREGQTTSE